MLVPVCFPKNTMVSHNFLVGIIMPLHAPILAHWLTYSQILIIGLVQLQVLENWFEVYVEQNLFHNKNGGLGGLEIGLSGLVLA
ncbi:MAG: hypothetical protein VW124_18595 [Paracoccaceae bacterium]